MTSRCFYVPRIIFGIGAVSRLVTELSRLGVMKPLVVTGKSLTFADKIPADKVVFNKVEPEPSVATAESTAELARSCDAVIGIGGGSALDVAKAAALAVTNMAVLNDATGARLLCIARTHLPALP